MQGLTSAGAIQFNSGSTFTSTGNIVSGNQIIGGANGNMTLANVTSSGGAGTVELASRLGNISTGQISATTDIATIANGSLSLGQVSGRTLVLLAGSNVQIGALSAGAQTNPTTGAITGATADLLIGNASLGGAGGQFGSYNFSAVFNALAPNQISIPQGVGGSITITGPVYANNAIVLAQGAITAAALNGYSMIDVEAGGLMTVNGLWSSPKQTYVSNDIAIAAAPSGTTTAPGLNAGLTGTITLNSINGNGTFVGDGLTAGQGYALSNAEWATIRSGSVTVRGASQTTAAPMLTIGTLAITGPQAGSTIDNQQNGAVLFTTGFASTRTTGGTIRIVGPLTAKGFLATNQLQFQTGTFELDTTSGSVSVADTSGALAGGISISADRIHIATASILDKLRADPLYANRIIDLNTAPTQPPANAVLSASQLVFAPNQTLYIQNTGTATVPAGFLVPLAGLTIKTPSSQSTTAGQTASSVSLVINGQFAATSTTGSTAAAAITGTTAFQQFLQQTKLTGIAGDSTFNSCVIAAGMCGMATPTPSLSSQIAVLQSPALPDAPAVVQPSQQQQTPELTAETEQSAAISSEPQEQAQSADKPTEAEQKEEEEAKASAKAPIAPPAPMIDTRPLSPPVSVDEPVAGGGNPALFGIGVAANQTEGGVK